MQQGDQRLRRPQPAGVIAIKVRSTRRRAGDPEFIWIEELVDSRSGRRPLRCTPCSSAPDERHVTMQAYENPVFVEDIVRNVAVRLQDDTASPGSESTPSITRASTTTAPLRGSNGDVPTAITVLRQDKRTAVRRTRRL